MRTYERNADGLTRKQEAFVRHIVEGNSGTQAAILAGYSERTAKEMAYENLTKPHITQAIAKLQGDIAERVDVTQDKIVFKLWRNAEAAYTDKQYAASNQAIRDIALITGIYTPTSKRDITVEHKAIEQYSDAELRAIVEASTGRVIDGEVTELPALEAPQDDTSGSE